MKKRGLREWDSYNTLKINLKQIWKEKPSFSTITAQMWKLIWVGAQRETILRSLRSRRNWYRFLSGLRATKTKGSTSTQNRRTKRVSLSHQ